MSKLTSAPAYILALDYGRRRVGVAGCRLDIPIALGITTLTISSTEDLYDQLQPLLQEYSPQVIILGFPITLGDRAGNLADEILGVANHLRARGFQVQLVDEALTSRTAAALVQQRGKKGKKEDLDRLAASLMLQDYLDGKLPPLTSVEIDRLKNRN